MQYEDITKKLLLRVFRWCPLLIVTTPVFVIPASEARRESIPDKPE